MGLIRKTLMVFSGGLVRGNSKKQRVAKAQLKQLRTQTKLQQQMVGQQASQSAPVQAPPTPSGWYPSPDIPGKFQWWNGTQWTPAMRDRRPIG